MTDILCKWLNNEVKLSTHIDEASFAREFASGYLIGEVLSKYQLQDDFDQFTQSKSADSKLNNFTRLEPVLHLLGIPFDTNTAHEIMTEKHGLATRLMYQTFIALNKKVKANLTGVAMETMRPAAPVKLENVESGIYKERLKHMTPRQTDLNLDALKARFHQKQIQMETTAFKERFEEQTYHQDMLQSKRQDLLQKYKDNKARQSEMLAKISSRSLATSTSPDPSRIYPRMTSSPSLTAGRQGAATVQIPKPPPSRTVEGIARRKQLRKDKEGSDTRCDIAQFEERMKRMLPPTKPFDADEGDEVLMDMSEAKEVAGLPDTLDLIRTKDNSEYIGRIRKRLNEDASARAEREKRRRKVLVDQLKAHEAQEEARREEMLVNRLMRQSQQERRIAVQLLQARHEKETIRSNRMIREQQYEERRLKDFEEALNREAELARLAKLQYIEQTKRDKELHDQIAAQRAEERYKKHYDMCMDTLLQMVDFSTKVGEYRDLTNNLLPPKLMRDWTSLFVEGKPLYEQAVELPPDPENMTPEQILELERQQLLNEGDFNEYRNMIGEWQPPEGNEFAGPPRNNPIVGHIVQRLFNIVHPPTPPPPPPEFPPFPIKACVVGKLFSGKTSCAQKLAENHRLVVLNTEDLVAEAVEAHKNGEVIEIQDEPEDAGVVPSEMSAVPPGGEISTEPAGAQDQAAEAASAKSVGKDGAGSTMGSAVGKGGPASAVGSVGPSAVGSQPDNRDQEEGASHPPPVHEEGMEKGDPEKPVDDKAEDAEPSTMVKSSIQSSATPGPTKRATDKKPAKPKATARAKLGAKAIRFLKRGKPVEDQVLVDILVEAIRRIPEGTGWVLDGFPTTYAQAKLLEKVLSGFDAQSRESTKTNLKAEKGKMKKSQLAPDPRPPPVPTEPSSGIDVVILFDLPNEICLKRSAGRTYASQAQEQYQQEFKPPPEGSATGIGKVEKVMPVEDASHDQEQIQHRITSFQDAWPKMEKWFNKFGTLKKIDAGHAEETVFLEVENIFENVLRRLEGKEEESLVLETEAKEEEKPPEPEPKPVEEPPPEPPKEEVRPDSKKGSRSGSGKKSGSRASSKDSKGKREKSESPKRSRPGSKADSGKKGSRGSSPKSPKRGRSGKKGKTPEPEPEPEPEVPPGTPPPQPGSDEWEYVDEPIDDELAHILAPYWEAIENTYVNSSKSVFQNIRDEREAIIRYFFQIKKDYVSYLRRPDHKQEFVSQWQKDYNAVSDDMREDEETRAELHERVDDLRETLWTICDERKEQAEKERENVIQDGWLEDRLGVLSNHYITVMQGEVDRYQDTVHLLKDYYRGMEGKIPDEQQTEFVRIPLVELPPTERPGSPAKSTTSETAAAPPAAGSATSIQTPPEEIREVKSSLSKSGTPSGKRGKRASAAEEKPSEESVLSEPPAEEGKKTRIPLVPRRPVSPDAGAAGAKDKKEKGKGKGKDGKGADPGVESPQPPEDLDERLLFDAYINGLGAADKILSAEQAAVEAEIEAELEKEREKEREREKEKAAASKKGGKGGKGKKSRSPSPKKGKGKTPEPEPTPPPPAEESEEEKQKKLVREKMRQEFLAAAQEEAKAVKMRLELVKLVGCGVLQDLKGSAEAAYKDMNDWLGARFLKEMESIDHMSEITRHAIEAGDKMKEELMLEQEEFLVDSDVKVLKTPSPVPRPPPVEQPQSDAFTVDQLMNIYKQFALTAPSGVISLRGFQETFQDLTALTYGTEQMPDIWMNVGGPVQLEAIASALSPDGEFIDWRTFLLAAAHPWPIPSQADLLDTLQRFQDMDQKSTGFVTREQFERVDLWFTAGTKPPTPADPKEPYPYDRTASIKQAFFDIFADFDKDPPQLDYVSMLLYFSASPDPYIGYLRALSVASGTHMPHAPRAKPPVPRPGSQASMAGSVDMEKEKAIEVEPEDIPESALQAKVPLDALHKVLHHGQSLRGDTHRFSVTADPEDAFSMERLAGVYQELGTDDLDPIPFMTLIEHPVIQDVISMCNTYRAVDLKVLLSLPSTETLETHSTKTATE